MLKKNDIYDIAIESDSGSGSGVCRIDNVAVFVEGAVSGDYLRIKIVNVRSSYAKAIIDEILMPSPYRRGPLCNASFLCGGCDFSHVSYDRQLDIKKERVLDCLARIGKVDLSGVEYYDTIGMDEPTGYRNKMVFPLGYDSNGKTIGGFYAKESHDIVELEYCSQGHSIASEYLSAVLRFMKEYNVAPYDESMHRGIVRRLFVRLGKSSGEAMVVISINAPKLPNAEKLCRILTDIKSADYNLVSIIVNVNMKKNNLVLGPDNMNIFGRGYINDTICGISYKISPHSFFQINPIQTEVLYKKALEFASLSGKETVVDLYCGIGTISLTASRLARSVIGIEIVEQSILDARNNAIINGIDNVTFIEGSADSVSQKLLDSGITPEVVILDPPRKGSDELTLNAISRMSPNRIVYISCNPATLARDVLFLSEKGYVLKKVQPVDMFPNTSHVECIILMTKCGFESEK